MLLHITNTVWQQPVGKQTSTHMKTINTPLFRSIVAIAVGVLMIQYRNETVKWLTIGAGILFFISGVVSIVFYYAEQRKATHEIVAAEATGHTEMCERVVSQPSFPVAGIGSAALGAILCLMPAMFSDFLSYVLAAILIVGAVGEYVLLVQTHSAISDYKRQLKGMEMVEGALPTVPSLGIAYWILPTLLLLFGVLAIIRPEAVSSALEASPALLTGVALVVYGVSEMVGSIKCYFVNRTIRRELNAIAKAKEQQAAEAAAAAEAEIAEDITEEAVADAGVPAELPEPDASATATTE